MLSKQPVGECALCGYKKCSQALQFHHVEPNKKDFNISSYSAMNHKKICAELKKCILVCATCHVEIHNGFVKQQLEPNFNESAFLDEWQKSEKKSYCPVCKKQKDEFKTTCSAKCSAGSYSKRIDWEKVDLYKLIIEDDRSILSIARELAVSDNAVRKRAKKIGIL